MKGITMGEWVIGDEFENEYGVNTVRIDVMPKFTNCVHVFDGEEDNGGCAKIEAKLICTAGNLTNAGYNIKAMPQLVEALEEMKVFYHSWLQQESETLGYKSAIKALEALKSAKL